MVSLYISLLGKVISPSTSPADTYEILRRARYLSYYAIWRPASVITVIEHTTDEFRRSHGYRIGDELWRHIQRALGWRGYLSLRGLVASIRYVARGPP
jgi:hypothetical protein